MIERILWTDMIRVFYPDVFAYSVTLVLTTLILKLEQVHFTSYRRAKDSR